MAITPDDLLRVAELSNLRLEQVGPMPQEADQPQVVRIVPSALYVTAAGGIPLPGTPMSDLLRVQIRVEWEAKGANGQPVEYATVPPDPGNQRLRLPFFFGPTLVEDLRGRPRSFTTRYVEAHVTLSAKPDALSEVTATIEDPFTLPVSVPDLPIPTVALFFEDPDYGILQQDGQIAPLPRGDYSFMLAVVPQQSPIEGAGTPSLVGALERLNGIITTLGSLTTAAEDTLSIADMAPGLSTIIETVDAYTPSGEVGVVLKQADKISDLGDVTMIHRHGWGPISWFRNDTEAGDQITSLILLGKPKKAIRCYQHEEYGGWKLTVSAGDDCYTLVESLKAQIPDTDPAGLSKSTIPTIPPWLQPFSRQPTWTNRISSIAYIN